jgi:Response regulator containing a CheY-like receiver domain and an HTH DNA-binding domain
MINPGLLAYFILSYSVGLVALVVSLASLLKRRSAPAWDFFLATLTFAIIGTDSMVMNLAYADAASRLLLALGLVNHAGAALFIALFPRLVHSVYKPARARLLNALSLAIACLTALAAAFLVALGLTEAAGRLVLGMKDIAILYSIVWIALNRRRRHDGEIENVLHFTMIGSAIIFPLIVLSELAPRALSALIPVETKGSITLPLVYMIWSVAYLLSWVRGYVRPSAATEDTYRAFSSRYGLSQRESEVIRHLLEGRSYKEIMFELSISMPTVKSHVSSIYRKTGCNNKMQLSLLFSSQPD